MKIEISTAKKYRLDKDYYPKMGLKKIGNKVLLKEDYPHNLPDNIIVEGNLYLSDMDIESLPDNLTVKGNLNLAFNKLTSLPEGLEVEDSMILWGNDLTSLPKDLKVGGNLYLEGMLLPDDYEILDTVEIGGEVYW